MPHRGGIELLQQLRRDGMLEHIRVAAYTSFGDLYRPDLEALGAVTVIDKSASPTDLVYAVRAVLERPAPGSY